MDLEFSGEQELLRRTLREVLERYSSSEAVRALEDDPVGYREDLWRELARLDVLGLTVPEEHGGAGQSALELAVLYEELGRALCPSPHLVSCVLAAGVLERAGSGAQRAAWLPRIASGEAVVTCAWWEPGRGDGPEGVQLQARPLDGGWALEGTKHLVPFAGAAGTLLTLARTGPERAEVGLFLVDRAGPGIGLEQQRTLASDTAFRVTYSGAQVPAEALVGEPGGGWVVWEEAMTDALIAVAAYAVGGAERAHEMAVAYAKERVQFGRPIGSFQAIAHPLAEMATEIAGARILTREAAWARARGREASTLAAMAKLYACDVFRRTTRLGHQVYGGIGFTLAIDMQLYFRRAKQLELLWWGPRTLEERVAAAELDAPVPFVSVDAGVER